MQTNNGQVTPKDANPNPQSIDPQSQPEQDSVGRGSATGNATGFVDPAIARKNKDALQTGNPNDVGEAGDYSR